MKYVRAKLTLFELEGDDNETPQDTDERWEETIIQQLGIMIPDHAPYPDLMMAQLIRAVREEADIDVLHLPHKFS